MPSFNQWTAIGNLTRDPQLKYLPSNMAITEFGMACDRKFKVASGEEREEVLFIDVCAFGKKAETLNQYVKKGDPLFVTARLKLDTWDDKTTGAKRFKVTAVIESFQFIRGKDSAGDESDQRTPARGRQHDQHGDDDPPF